MLGYWGLEENKNNFLKHNIYIYNIYTHIYIQIYKYQSKEEKVHYFYSLHFFNYYVTIVVIHNFLSPFLSIYSLFSARTSTGYGYLSEGRGEVAQIIISEESVPLTILLVCDFCCSFIFTFTSGFGSTRKHHWFQTYSSLTSFYIGRPISPGSSGPIISTST